MDLENIGKTSMRGARITSNIGKTGTRIVKGEIRDAVRSRVLEILEKLAAGENPQNLLTAYPELTGEDINAVLALAAAATMKFLSETASHSTVGPATGGKVKSRSRKAFTLRLPPHLYRLLQEAARQEGISMQQLVLLAVAEKLAALQVEQKWFERLAQDASRERYLAALMKVPDVPPDPEDAIEDEVRARLSS